MNPGPDGDRLLLAHMRECIERVWDIKATKTQVSWRELAGFRNVIVHGYLGIDLAAAASERLEPAEQARCG